MTINGKEDYEIKNELKKSVPENYVDFINSLNNSFGMNWNVQIKGVELKGNNYFAHIEMVVSDDNNTSFTKREGFAVNPSCEKALQDAIIFAARLFGLVSKEKNFIDVDEIIHQKRKVKPKNYSSFKIIGQWMQNPNTQIWHCHCADNEGNEGVLVLGKDGQSSIISKSGKKIKQFLDELNGNICCVTEKRKKDDYTEYVITEI